MRYIIYGAGGIGCVIGGKLHQAGKEVVLIARGAHLAALRDKGLTLHTPGSTDVLNIPAVGHPSELEFRDDDIVFLTMKSQDTERALDELIALGGRDLPIVCTQNGVENERIALRRFEAVYGMMVFLPATFLEPGVVVGSAAPLAGVLDAGCYPGGTDERIVRVCADLEEAGFGAHPDPAVMRFKYSKLLMNLGNALQAAIGPELRLVDVGAALRDEAEACYRAAGVDWATPAEEKARRENMSVQPVEGQERGGGSTWQSLVRGLPTVETDFMNGEIVLLGRLHGVPTPVNAALQDLAQRLVAEGKPPGAMTESELRAALGVPAPQT